MKSVEMQGVIWLAGASGSSIHPSQKALGRAKHKIRREERCCGSLERVDHRSTLPGEHWEGPNEKRRKAGSVVARRSEWIVDPPFPESTRKGLMKSVEQQGVLWLAGASGSSIHPSQRAPGRA